MLIEELVEPASWWHNHHDEPSEQDMIPADFFVGMPHEFEDRTEAPAEALYSRAEQLPGQENTPVAVLSLLIRVSRSPSTPNEVWRNDGIYPSWIWTAHTGRQLSGHQSPSLSSSIQPIAAATLGRRISNDNQAPSSLRASFIDTSLSETQNQLPFTSNSNIRISSHTELTGWEEYAVHDDSQVLSSWVADVAATRSLPGHEDGQMVAPHGTSGPIVGYSPRTPRAEPGTSYQPLERQHWLDEGPNNGSESNEQITDLGHGAETSWQPPQTSDAETTAIARSDGDPSKSDISPEPSSSVKSDQQMGTQHAVDSARLAYNGRQHRLRFTGDVGQCGYWTPAGDFRVTDLSYKHFL